MSLKERVYYIKEEAKNFSLNSKEDLEKFRLKFLVKKSEMMELFNIIKDLAGEDRKEAGRILNEAKKIIEEKFQIHQDNLVNDPENLELVNQKLQNIYNLQKKHQVNSIAELLEIQNDLDNKVVSVVELEFEIKKLTSKILESTSELDKLALIIRKNRLKTVPVLSEKLIFISENLHTVLVLYIFLLQ